MSSIIGTGDDYVDVRIRLRDARQFQAEAKASAAAIDDVGKKSKTAGSNAKLGERGFIGMESAMGLAKRTAAGLVAGLAALGTAGLVQGLRYDATMEQNVVAFKNFLGSTEAAQKQLDTLAQMAATSPFEFPDIVTASRKFLAFGFSVEETNRILGVVGDTIAGIGGGSAEIQRMTLALGQMRAKGKLSAEELLQLTELGIPAYDILREKLHLTNEQVANIGTAGISAEQGITALMEGLSERFAGASADQAKTLLGQVSTIKDNVNQLLGAASQPVADWLSHSVTPAISSMTTELTAAFKESGLSGFMDVLVDSLEDATGNTNIFRKGWARVTSIASSAWEIFRDGILPALAEVWKAIDKIISPMKILDGLLGFLGDHTTLVKVAVIALASGIIAYNAAVAGAMLVTKGVAIATRAWTAAQWLLNLAMNANPIGLVITAIAAVVAGVVIAYRKFDWFRDLLNNIWNWIKDNWPLIAGLLTAGLATAVIEIIKHWDSIRDGFIAAVGKVREWADWLVSFFTGLPGRIAAGAGDLWGWIVDNFKTAVNWLIGVWNWLMDAMSFTVNIPDWVPGLPDEFHIDLGVGKIPQLADGGTIISQGAAIVGERGPELLTLPVGAQVQPLQEPRPLTLEGFRNEGRSPVQVTVPVYLDRRQIAEAVADYTEERMARR